MVIGGRNHEPGFYFWIREIRKLARGVLVDWVSSVSYWRLLSRVPLELIPLCVRFSSLFREKFVIWHVSKSEIGYQVRLASYTSCGMTIS